VIWVTQVNPRDLGIGGQTLCVLTARCTVWLSRLAALVFNEVAVHSLCEDG
jgi:hypothetical protein